MMSEHRLLDRIGSFLDELEYNRIETEGEYMRVAVETKKATANLLIRSQGSRITFISPLVQIPFTDEKRLFLIYEYFLGKNINSDNQFFFGIAGDEGDRTLIARMDIIVGSDIEDAFERVQGVMLLFSDFIDNELGEILRNLYFLVGSDPKSDIIKE